MSESSPPPGWYADPTPQSGQQGQRYWDGSSWTEHTAPPPYAPPQPAYGATQPMYGATQPGYGATPPAYGATQPVYGAPQAAYGAPQPGYGAPPPGKDGFAIASLIFGLIGGIPLAVIFGIVALVRIGKSRQGGKGLAIAGLVLAGLWVVGIGAAIAVAASNGSLDTASRGQIAQTDLAVGDCIELPRVVPELPRTFAARKCSALHNGEVFRIGALPAGTYPGESTAASTVLKTCQDQLSSFLGGQSTNSLLHVVYIYPTADSWSSGQRRYVCIVVDRGQDVTGTMRGQLANG